MRDTQLPHQLASILVFLKRHKLKKAAKKLRKQIEKEGVEIAKQPLGQWKWIPHCELSDDAATDLSECESFGGEKQRQQNDLEQSTGQHRRATRPRKRSPDAKKSRKQLSYSSDETGSTDKKVSRKKKASPSRSPSKGSLEPDRRHRRHSSLRVDTAGNDPPSAVSQHALSMSPLKQSDDSEEEGSESRNASTKFAKLLSQDQDKPFRPRPSLARAESEAILVDKAKKAPARPSLLRASSVRMDPKQRPGGLVRQNSVSFSLGATEEHVLSPRKQFKDKLYYNDNDIKYFKVDYGNEKLQRATKDARAFLKRSESSRSLLVELDSTESSGSSGTSESSTCVTDFDESISAMEEKRIKEVSLVHPPNLGTAVGTARSLFACTDSGESSEESTETSESSTCATDFDDSVAALGYRSALIKEVKPVLPSPSDPKTEGSLQAHAARKSGIHNMEENVPPREKKKKKKSTSKDRIHGDKQRKDQRRHSTCDMELYRNDKKKTTKKPKNKNAKAKLRRASSCDGVQSRRPSLSVWKPLDLPEL